MIKSMSICKRHYSCLYPYPDSCIIGNHTPFPYHIYIVNVQKYVKLFRIKFYMVLNLLNE